MNESRPRLRYALEMPAQPGAGTPVVVAVHGISRNASDHHAAFAGLAQSRGAILVVPLFEAAEFRDYQRLGRDGRGQRADLALLSLIDGVLSSRGLSGRRFHLFGHSGGAQFAHRFVMAHPERVARYAISAAGWYTFPDDSQDFPYGLRHPPSGIDMSRQRLFLSVPGRVFVGMRDQRRGTSLRQHERVDAEQGRTRIERATRWTAAMNARAQALDLRPPLDLRQLPGSGHSFGGLVRRAALHEQVWAFLLESQESSREVANA
ncbi:MAG TPA: alpha/beta hydrolase [Casimicrobiaceae bacterium]|nr:alpha/beta hydrolase [Casimicrobiaceae bacterium]